MRLKFYIMRRKNPYDRLPTSNSHSTAAKLPVGSGTSSK